MTSIEALRNWNVGNVINMNYTFGHCSGLTSVEALANWNLSKVTNNMTYMFYESNKVRILNLANTILPNSVTFNISYLSGLEVLRLDNLTDKDKVQNIINTLPAKTDGKPRYIYTTLNVIPKQGWTLISCITFIYSH